MSIVSKGKIQPHKSAFFLSNLTESAVKAPNGASDADVNKALEAPQLCYKVYYRIFRPILIVKCSK